MKNRLSVLRGQKLEKGISKAHLARQIGVSRSYITMLEQGKIQPSIRVALRMAKYFGCSVEELFGDMKE